MADAILAEAAAQVVRLLSGDPGPGHMTAALRHLAKWRAMVLDRALAERSGTTVLTGPFAGMAYPLPASEGARAARLLGSYEHALVPVIETIISRPYTLVIDVGAAEGYYAVGLARRMPGARVLARDQNPRAQALCRELARLNGVEGRVLVGGVMEPSDFALCLGERSVVLCDIEGAEDTLLDPHLGPGLLGADVLVEVHEGMHPGLLARLTERFSPSHSVRRIDRALNPDALPPWAEALSDLDRLILLWEWRASPTPWLWMEARA